MIIKQTSEYENATCNILFHKDTKFFNNFSLSISCTKSRKINDMSKISNWSDLKFNFEFKNHDIQYGSIGGYKNIVLNKNEFIDLVLSIKTVLQDENCFENDITIKRLIKDVELFVRFSVSQKYNTNAILIGVITSKNGIIHLGIDSIVFDYYVLQMYNLIKDIINYEINFDQNILMYKNNQYLEYIAHQNKLLLDKYDNNVNDNNTSHNIEILENNIKNEINNDLEENDNKTCTDEEIENDGINVNVEESSNVEEVENDNMDNENKNKSEIDNNNDDKEEKEDNENESMIKENLDEFLENLDEDLDNIQLQPLLKIREDSLNMTENIESKEEPSELCKYISDNNIKLTEFFQDIYKNCNDKKSFAFDGLDYYFNKLGMSIDKIIYNNISENDLKSIHYLSQLQYFKLLTEYRTNNNIDNFYSISLKYDYINKIDNLSIIKNINDIISIYLYVKSMSEKMVNRESDITKNKIFLMHIIRIIFEPYFLSYYTSLGKIVNNFDDIILKHYYQIRETGFFDDFDKILKDYDLTPVNVNDIKKQIVELKGDILENNVNLSSIHNNLVKLNIVKLPYKNIFDREHINEICKIECSLGTAEYTKEELIEIINNNKITDKTIIDFIKKTYIKKQKSNKIDINNIHDLDNTISNVIKKTTSNTPLYRYINKYIENSEKYKEALLQYIKQIEYNDVDLQKVEEIEELYKLPDNIIIALSKWKNIQDNKNMKSYSYFINLVNNSIESKKDILTYYMMEKENIVNNTDDTDVNDDWDILN